jgi:hypothetical protein
MVLVRMLPFLKGEPRAARLRLGRHRLRPGFRFRRFWSGPPRSGGGSSQSINLPCRSQRVITRKAFRVAKRALSSGSARFCSTAELAR